MVRSNHTHKEVMNFINEISSTNKINGVNIVLNDIPLGGGYGYRYSYLYSINTAITTDTSMAINKFSK